MPQECDNINFSCSSSILFEFISVLQRDPNPVFIPYMSPFLDSNDFSINSLDFLIFEEERAYE